MRGRGSCRRPPESSARKLEIHIKHRRCGGRASGMRSSARISPSMLWTPGKRSVAWQFLFPAAVAALDAAAASTPTPRPHPSTSSPPYAHGRVALACARSAATPRGCSSRRPSSASLELDPTARAPTAAWPEEVAGGVGVGRERGERRERGRERWRWPVAEEESEGQK
ncbi:unnamed protein product, partial [Urochloa humidicola]